MSTKVCIPVTILHNPVLLEGICVVAVLGDPTSDSYESSIPGFPHLMVVGLGSVTSPARTLADGTSKAFDIMSSDYVWDARMTSTVCCMFDSAHPQWSKTPVPNQNMVVFYIGHFSNAASTGGLQVELESITLNVSMESRSSISTLVSPISKKCKFMAIAPKEGDQTLSQVRKSDKAPASSPTTSPINDWCEAASSTTATHQSPKSMSCLVMPQNKSTIKGMVGTSATRGRGKARQL
ncbi:hypothetical protein F5141DRAFT_1210640 [Pisolithus sp. B1]|nr:hypothetical protein F5141DRAFT_1210640 [Pisolithus sp. B1]